MSRFVLLSAVLHLGVLAALGLSAVRPPLFPATLSVTLSTAADTTPARHRDASARHVNAANADAYAIRSEPRPSPRDIAQRDVTNHLAQAPQEIAAKNDQTDLIAPEPDSHPTRAELSRQDEPLAETPRRPDPQAQRTDTNQLASQLESRLRDALAPYFTYPLMARRNGWQGQVQVGLRVEADGRLSHVRIAQSSGYRLLDSAAVTTLNRIEALPNVAGWLDGRHFDMVLPIEYRLIGG